MSEASDAPAWQLRVHGIGGPTAGSVLGLPPGRGAQVIWQRDDRARATLRAGADDQVAVYHWAPLTSGSRWFALWPLLLPFTIINVAGWMHPTGRLRGPVARAAEHLVALATTASFVGWSLLATQLLARRWDAAPHWGVVAALAALALVVATAGWSRGDFEGAQAPTPPGATATPTSSLAALFRPGRHPTIVVAHAAVTGVAIGYVLGRAARPVITVVDTSVALVTATGALQAVGLVLLAVVTIPEEGRGPWRLAPLGAAAAGVALAGGLVSGGLLTVLGTCPVDAAARSEAPKACAMATLDSFAVVDLYGLSALVALGVLLFVVTWHLLQQAPLEEVSTSRRLLHGPMARARGRAAVALPSLAVALGLAALAFLGAALVLYPSRAPDRVVGWCDDLPGLAADGWGCRSLPDAAPEDRWLLTDTPMVGVARFTFLALIGFVFLNLARSRASFDQLRRIGNLWDVLTFWPRAYHPFAVRPYGERAVPDLQQILAPDGPGRPPGPTGHIDVRAHSQGSVLVLAALAGLGRPNRARSVVTFGSPIRSLYREAFPAIFTDDVVTSVGVPWLNLFRATDHVGRTLFVPEDAWRPDPPTADRALPDPPTPGAAIAGHSGYWRDADLDRIARAWAAAPPEEHR